MDGTRCLQTVYKRRKEKEMWPLWLRIVFLPIRFVLLVLFAIASLTLYMCCEGEKAESIMDWIIDLGCACNS